MFVQSPQWCSEKPRRKHWLWTDHRCIFGQLVSGDRKVIPLQCNNGSTESHRSTDWKPFRFRRSVGRVENYREPTQYRIDNGRYHEQDLYQRSDMTARDGTTSVTSMVESVGHMFQSFSNFVTRTVESIDTSISVLFQLRNWYQEYNKRDRLNRWSRSDNIEKRIMSTWSGRLRFRRSVGRVENYHEPTQYRIDNDRYHEQDWYQRNNISARDGTTSITSTVESVDNLFLSYFNFVTRSITSEIELTLNKQKWK